MTTALNIKVPKAYWVAPAILVAIFLGFRLYGAYALYSLNHPRANEPAVIQRLSISQGESPLSHRGTAASSQPMELMAMPTRPEAAHMS